MEVSKSPSQRHLVVFVHGFLGRPRAVNYCSQQLVNHLGDEILVFKSSSNKFFKTCHGIQITGRRLSDEVKKIVKEYPSLEYISFVGISLGGLIMRYAIGLLYDDLNKTIATLKPISFVTFASPHLGTRVGLTWLVQNFVSYLPILRPTTDELFYRDIPQSSSTDAKDKPITNHKNSLDDDDWNMYM